MLNIGRPVARSILIPDGTIAANDRLTLVGVYPFDAGLTVAPLLVSAAISSDGDSISLTFDQAVTFGAGGNGGVTITPSGGASTATYSSGDTTDTLVYSLSRTIDFGETVTLDYTQPGNGIEADDDNTDVDSFSSQFVANASVINRPMVNSVSRLRLAGRGY
jgi:hypothetical protein